jgi:hypothetical protein
VNDLVVLIDVVPEKSAGDDLRGHVDDVGLDKDVIGDGVVTSVFDPAHHRHDRGGDERHDRHECEEPT